MKCPARLRAAAIATAQGWAAAWALTLPLQLTELFRNADAGVYAFIVSLAVGLTFWTAFTFVFCCLAALIFLAPVAILIPIHLLASHRRIVVTVTVVAGVVVVGFALHIWTGFHHDGVGFYNFDMYAMFAAIFAVVTPLRYLRPQIPS